jgi:ferric-dicitrate binding protein FerR (iron transport regulator)
MRMNLCGHGLLFPVRIALNAVMDLELLRRFALGDCVAAEREAVARWLDEDPTRQSLIEAVRRLVRNPAAWTQEFDCGHPWAGFARALRAVGPRDGAVRLRLAPKSARVLTVAGASRGSAWRRAGVWVLATAAAVALGVRMAWRPLAQVWSDVPHAAATRGLTAPRGARAALTLSDGTRVELAAGSRLWYPASFDDSIRAVSLDGEAYFAVRHDVAHPFEVRTRGGVVRDLGTAFVVRQYREDAGFEVVVTEGRIAVRARAQDAAAARDIDAGHLVRIDTVGHTEVRTVDPASYLAWMHGRLVFDDVPLQQVLEELSRWYDADVRVADTTLATRRFTGVFSDEPLDSVLSALAPPMHVRVQRHGRTIVVSRLPDLR